MSTINQDYSTKFWGGIHDGFRSVVSVMELREDWAIDLDRNADDIEESYQNIVKGWSKRSSDEKFLTSCLEFFSGLPFGVALMAISEADSKLGKSNGFIETLCSRASLIIGEQENANEQTPLVDAANIFLERFRILLAAHLWGKAFGVTKEQAVKAYLEHQSNTN